MNEIKYADLPPEILQDFKAELLENIESVNNLLLDFETKKLSEEEADELKRKLHNLKGHSGYLKLQEAAEISHILENLILAIENGLYKKNDIIELLLDGAKELQTFYQNIQISDDSLVMPDTIDLELLLQKLKLFDIEEEKLQDLKSSKIKKSKSKKPPKTEKAKKSYAKYDYNSRSEEDIKMFIDEAHEMLDNISNTLLKFEKNPDDLEAINKLFRVLHTLKGASGMLELLSVCDLSHSLEELLELIRDGKLKVTDAVVDIMFAGIDEIQELTNKFEKREEVNIDVDEMLEKIKNIKTGNSSTPQKKKTKTNKKSQTSKSAKTDDSSIELASDKSTPAESRTSNIPKAPPKTMTLQTLRIDVSKIDSVLNRMGELVIEKIKLQTFVKEFFDYENRLTYIKHDIVETGITDKTENTIINIIDDFEILRDKLLYITEGFDRLSGELQDGIMKMRLVPLAQLFSRFPRVVRDLSKQIGKEINFNIEGEETEIDKNIIESLMDPLVHIIRNSIDHGIEKTEARKKKGKSSSGNLLLKAYYKGNNVVIEITDDGAGLDIEKIKNKCIEKKLIEQDILNQMSDEEIMQQIFRPGFSTAEKVTDLSGRGVGMDVVRKTIEDLNGTVIARSEKDKYSTVLITIPLTLAIMQVLLVKVSGQLLAIPLYTIQETVYTKSSELYELSDKLVFNFRGKVIPLIELKTVLGINSSRSNNNRVPIAIINFGDKEYGFIIDDFEGKQEIVIKVLGKLIERAPFVSGATTMGDGSVVLILDVMSVIRHAGKYRFETKENELTKYETKVPVKTRKKVLVVDDAPVIRKSIIMILKELGLECDQAENGVVALDKIMKTKYDMLTVDIMMPEMDGYQLCIKLRELEEYRQTPVIAISSKGEKISKVKGFQCGFDEYVVKPLNKDLLLSVVKKYI
jgi:two-component system, chemotaxis family, sensor kinase CheA